MVLTDHATAQITPEQIMHVAAGYMSAKHLFAACELGLFEALAAGPTSIEDLAEQLGLDAGRLRIIADANTTLGFIERREGGYANSAVAQMFLSGQSPSDFRPLLRFWNRVSYPMWTQIEQTVRTGQGHAPDFSALDLETQRIFSHGVEAISKPTANALSASYDFGQHKRVLDVGGGTGSFLLSIRERYPELGLTLFELPGAAALARKRLADQPIEVIAGDMFRDPLPAEHDAVLCANVVHILSSTQNIELLRRLRQSLIPGGRVLLVDFWLDEARTSPPIGALIAGEFMTITGVGRSYAVDEAKDWLHRSGFHYVEQIWLAGPQSVIIAEAC